MPLRLYVGLIAYVPWVEKPLLDLTERAVRSTVAHFGALTSRDHPVVAYHAVDPIPVRGLCKRVHPRFPDVRVIDYVNGSLWGNWRRLLVDAFEADRADWALFTSNDVIWLDGSRWRVEDLMLQGDPLTMYVANPMAAFLISRELYERLRDGLDESRDLYPPSGFEDNELCMQVWAARGDVVDGKFAGMYEHEAECSIRLLGPDYHGGEHHSNFDRNRQTFVDRWGFNPESRLGRDGNVETHWPPSASAIAEARERGGPRQ